MSKQPLNAARFNRFIIVYLNVEHVFSPLRSLSVAEGRERDGVRGSSGNRWTVGYVSSFWQYLWGEDLRDETVWRYGSRQHWQTQDKLCVLELVAMASISGNLRRLLFLHFKAAVMVSGLRIHHAHHLRHCLHMMAHHRR